jgi:polyphosphate kinase
MIQQQLQWQTLAVELADAGIIVIDDAETAAAWRGAVEKSFVEQIFPILTPQALDPAHPFPFIPNKGLAVIFDLIPDGRSDVVRELVMIPPALPRFIRVPGRKAVYIAIDALVALFADILFPGFSVQAHGRFRLIRDSDIELEEEAEDLVRYFRSAIRRRRRGRITLIEFDAITSDSLREELVHQVASDDPAVQLLDGMVGLADLSEIVAEDRPELKFAPYTARIPERIREHGGDCLAAIKAKDILVHHPYESFDVVLSFPM